MTSLDSQIIFDEMYRIFKPYRLGGDFVGCEHCVAESSSRHLASIPLNELTVRDVNCYAFKAMTTWGSERHFKHFLPRLLELAYHDYLAFNDPEVLLGKLDYAKWGTWPNTERAIIERFLKAFWLHQLDCDGDFPTDDRIRTVLGGLSNACPSIAEYLTLWGKCETVNAALHCAQLIDRSADDVMSTGEIHLWGNPPNQIAELVAWISSDHARRLLDRFCDRIIEPFPLVFSLYHGILAAVTKKQD